MTNSNNNELLLRIKILTSVMKLGHEAFERLNFEDACNHIVNNTGSLFQYDRALIYQKSRNNIIAVSGQPEVNKNSEIARSYQKLLQKNSKKQLIQISEQSAGALHESTSGLYHTIKGEREINIIISPLNPPGDNNSCDLFWVLEVDKENTLAMKVVPLLSKHYSEALHYSFHKKNRRFFSFSSLFTPFKMFCLFAIAVAASLYTIQTPIRAKAEFQIMPRDQFYYFSNTEGVVEKLLVDDETAVIKNDVVATLKDDRIIDALELSREELRELKNKYHLIEQASFEKPEEMAQAGLFKIKMEQQKIKIRSLERQLEETKIRAPANGLLTFKNYEKLRNKTLVEGELLFEISTADSTVEILLNEKDAELIRSTPKVELHFNSIPEKVFSADIMEISPRPELDTQNRFTYRILAETNNPNLIQGMRGTAVFKGKEILLIDHLKRGFNKWWNQ